MREGRGGEGRVEDMFSKRHDKGGCTGDFLKCRQCRELMT